jgi:hypothetical protein
MPDRSSFCRGLELAVGIAPLMQDPDDDDLGFCHFVDDDMLPHAKTLEVRTVVGPRPSEMGKVSRVSNVREIRRSYSRLWFLPHCCSENTRMSRRSLRASDVTTRRRLRADIGFGKPPKANLLIGFPADLLHQLRRPFVPFTALNLGQPLRN